MLLYSDPRFLSHITGSHPENAGRIVAIEKMLTETALPGKCTRGEVNPVSQESLLAVHGPGMLAKTESLAEKGGGRLDPDTVVSPKSFEIAKLAAGAACEAVERVAAGDDTRAVCLIRPPGHHALADRAMGFCLMNNVAIAARHAQRVCGLGRLLIIDWDVHHGNGTQDIFYDDDSIGFFSIHRFPFYPGSGDRDETGTGRGLGTTWNLPISMGTPRESFLKSFESSLNAAIQKMKPELILLSAGFDAHRLDPIGSLGLETEDFGTLTQMVKSAALAECDGRIVSLLEGGYDPKALADSVQIHLNELMK